MRVFSNRERVRGGEVLAKASPRNVGDLVFSESQKVLAIIIQNNCDEFVAHKE